MLKIKVKESECIDINENEKFIEYEFNKINNKIIFPVYLTKRYIEAVELIPTEDDFYILSPCVIYRQEQEGILNIYNMEDFNDILESINIFFEFNISILEEIEENSLKFFIRNLFSCSVDRNIDKDEMSYFMERLDSRELINWLLDCME